MSGSATAQLSRCGAFTSTTSITRTSGTVDTSIFVYSITATSTALTVTPTALTQVDTYTVLITNCLTNYGTVCATKGTIVTIAASTCSITTSSIPNSSVTVFAPSASYSAFTAFTATTACNTVTYTATVAPASGVSSLTSFAYGTLNF